MTRRRTVGAVMVVGGGISGIQSALDLADSGFKVYLVDRKPTIGGAMAQLDKTFPTNDCSMCIMAPKLVAVDKHPNIEIITNSEVKDVRGRAGRFKVHLLKHPRLVDEEKCNGCGMCSQKCPVEAIDMYNEGLMARAAIYVDYPQAVPLKYAIDVDRCIGCGICEGECPVGAIVYSQKEELRTVEVGSMILSPGFDEFPAQALTEYGYGRYPNVVSSIEFERMLSATGPFRGVVMRPSDGKVPKRVAFIQCVGSRDERFGYSYCSSVCCMHAIKEAIIAQEHTHGLSSHIFFMDIRTFGKEFDDYVERAKKVHGVQMSRANRVAELSELPGTNDLVLWYLDGDEIRSEVFNLVVLSVGLAAPESAGELSKVTGIQLNKHDFALALPFRPLETKVPGIFVSGSFRGPKDIPTTVAEASGAASKAGAVIADSRDTLLVEVKLPEERVVAGEEPRIGVFVCHCGINIGGVIDVPAVVEYARTLNGVVFAEHNLYTCSQDTQEHIKQMMEDYNLNRVIVASCTPRTHEALFRNTVREGGLNPYLFEMANIRDQCSWVHMHEPELATKKAKTLVRMSVARARLLEPLHKAVIPVTQRALVIGGGVSGMTAALDIANQGFPVHLVERQWQLGGGARRAHTTMHGDDVQRWLTQLIKEVKANGNITVHTGAEIEGIEGTVGTFRTTLRGQEQPINHGVIVIATGAEEHRPEGYLYGKDDRVVTQSEFGEELVEEAPADLPSDVVFIQCVGCRNEERPYCSRVCCGTTVMQANLLKKKRPDARVYVLYRDMRTYSFMEERYKEACENGVIFLRYNEGAEPLVSRGRRKVDPLRVDVSEAMVDARLRIAADRIVLAAAIVPPPDNEELAKMVKVPLSKDGFFLEAHMKLRPVDCATDGIFVAGLAHSPQYMEECIAQACGAAARAMTILSRPEREVEGVIASVNSELCRGCGTCHSVCEFGAIEMEEVEPGVRVSRISEALCKGCGMCVVACPSKAIRMRHFTEEQIRAVIEALLMGVT